MALTFRDFFIGLSESAPVMSKLVYDYTIWQYQQGMEERKMGLLERQTEADIARSASISEYYKTEREIATGKATRENQLFDATFSFQVKADEDRATIAENLRKYSDANMEATIGYWGSLPEAERQKLINNDQTRLDNRKLLLAQIDQALAQTTESKTGTKENKTATAILEELRRLQYKGEIALAT